MRKVATEQGLNLDDFCKVGLVNFAAKFNTRNFLFRTKGIQKCSCWWMALQRSDRERGCEEKGRSYSQSVRFMQRCVRAVVLCGLSETAHACFMD